MDKIRVLISIATLVAGSQVEAQGPLPGMWLWQSAEQVPCSIAYREGVLSANLALAQQWALMTQLQATLQIKSLQELNDPASIAANIGDAKLELAFAGLEVAQAKLQEREQELAALREENEKLQQQNATLQEQLGLPERANSGQPKE